MLDYSGAFTLPRNLENGRIAKEATRFGRTVFDKDTRKSRTLLMGLCQALRSAENPMRDYSSVFLLQTVLEVC